MKAITKSVSFASHHRTYLFSAVVTEDPPGKFDISLLSFVVARQVSTFPKDSLCLGFRAGIYNCFYFYFKNAAMLSNQEGFFTGFSVRERSAL